MLGLVSTWMSDSLRADKLSGYITGHPGNSIGAVSRGKNGDICSHAMVCHYELVPD